MSLRLRLVLLIAFCISLAVLVITTLFTQRLLLKSEEAISSWSTSLAAAVAKATLNHVLEGRHQLTADLLSRIQRDNNNIVYLVVDDFDGNFFASSLRVELPQEVMAVISRHDDSRDMLIFTLNQHKVRDVSYPMINHLGAHLHIGLDEDKFQEDIRSAYLVSLAYSLLVLLTAIGIGIYWAGRISRPLGQLAEQVAAYGRGEKFSPDAIDSGTTEIRTLSETMNRMIVERKRFVDHIVASEHQMRQMLDTSPIAVQIQRSSDGLLVFINRSYSDMLQADPGVILGADPVSFYQDPEDYSSILQRLSRGENVSNCEIRLRTLEGNTIWVLASYSYLEYENEPAILGWFYDFTERKSSEELIWRQANYDTLTQLPNRRLFTDRLEQDIKKAHRDQHLVGLLFLDLDRFKEVNDTMGHHVGDELLIEVAKRIQSCVRESDTVARLGGDEFTVILSELENSADVDRISQKLGEVLSQPFQLGGEQVNVSASIGVTVYPEDAESAQEMLKNADQAMYNAKQEGRNRISYFTRAMQYASQLRLNLAKDLRKAVAAGEFRVHYQPIVDLNTGSIRKAEALVRWQHPVHGFISPAAFIPIAEENGSIVDIGEWVFRQAVAQAGSWQESYGKDFQISVNKSPVQFLANDNAQVLWPRYLQECGLEGGSIVIEITEGLLLNTALSVTDKLARFREAGMQFAIDDFGTGYSSLAYIRKFDVDYLKIDQSFTRNLAPGTSELVLSEAIVVMAHKLGLKVVAEGVETESQRDLLVSIGCDYGQGYLFCKPVPAEELEKLLVKG